MSSPPLPWPLHLAISRNGLAAHGLSLVPLLARAWYWALLKLAGLSDLRLLPRRSDRPAWNALPSVVGGALRLAEGTVRSGVAFLAPHILFRQLLAVVVLQVVYEVYGSVSRRLRQWGLFAWSKKAKRKLVMERELRSARHYREWRETARHLDESEGWEAWKRQPDSPYYDRESIEGKIRLYSDLTRGRTKDLHALMFHLRGELLRKHWGLANDSLFKCRVGTKHLLEKYIDTVSQCLECIANEDDGNEALERGGVSLEYSLAFLNETRHSFGRSALLLSGGATMG